MSSASNREADEFERLVAEQSARQRRETATDKALRRGADLAAEAEAVVDHVERSFSRIPPQLKMRLNSLRLRAKGAGEAAAFALAVAGDTLTTSAPAQRAGPRDGPHAAECSPEDGA